MRSRIIFFWVLIAAMIGGCDRKPSPPQIQNAPTTVAGNEHPTTQELLSGTYRKFLLPGMPLSLKAPASWKLTTTDKLVLLEGPAPSNQAVIQLSVRQPIPADRVTPLIEGLKRDNESSSPPSRAEVRDLGPLRILERISTSRPTSSPKLNYQGNPVLDEKGNPLTVNTTALHWTLSVFVPEGQIVNHYELNVIGMTTDQYAMDKELLEKVLGSLAYERS